MKIRLRSGDASTLQDSDWLQTDGWLAALRDDGRAGPPAMATPGRHLAAMCRQKFRPRPLPGPRPPPAPQVPCGL